MKIELQASDEAPARPPGKTMGWIYVDTNEQGERMPIIVIEFEVTESSQSQTVQTSGRSTLSGVDFMENLVVAAGFGEITLPAYPDVLYVSSDLWKMMVKPKAEEASVRLEAKNGYLNLPKDE